MESFGLERPRLRPLELKWVEERGNQVLFMRDPSGIAPQSVLVPAFVASLLSCCDGERDIDGVRAAFELRTGQVVTVDRVRDVLRQLDELLFLDSPRYRTARDSLIGEYRQAAFRPPALAGRVYPAEPSKLLEELQAYRRDGDAGGDDPVSDLRAVISPHIDYQRGGPVYAATWQRAAQAVQEADVVIVFGTDHCGGLGRVTLTRQSYATPLGTIPTALDVVDAIAEAIGPEDAFAEEIHHRNEHSIELATVWLHSLRRGVPPPMVPILCGSFHHFSTGEADPHTDERFAHLLDALRTMTEGRRVLAVAAADLAHVGPAFGDAVPYQDADRRELAKKDEKLLEAICHGDAGSFFGQLRAEEDARRICGLPPIYLTLRFLGTSEGEVVDYDQCPADAEGGSLVSIGGVLLR